MLFPAFRRKFVFPDGFPGSSSPVPLLSLVLHGEASDNSGITLNGCGLSGRGNVMHSRTS